MATDVKAVIEQAVRTALAPVDVGGIEVETAYDHADEEALFITVDLPPATPPVEGKKYLAAMAGVSEALLASGDGRFPYLRLKHVGEEAADESPDIPGVQH